LALYSTKIKKTGTHCRDTNGGAGQPGMSFPWEFFCALGFIP